MRVIIRDKDTNINIPIPMWIVNMGIRISALIGKQYCRQQVKRQIYSNVKDKYDKDSNAKKYNNMIKYVDMIDYKMLLTAMKELKNYKGLNLVEVEESNGTYVLVRI